MKKNVLQFVLSVFAILLHLSSYAQVNGGKKILVVTTNSDKDLKYGTDGWGCYFPEVVDFYSKIRKYGFTTDDIDIVSLQGGQIPLFEAQFELPVSADDQQKLRDKVKNTLKPAQVKADDYNVIYYAGGISCLVDYPSSASIGDIAKSIYEKGGVVAAVCDGISGLIPIQLSNGKPLTDGVKVTTNDYQIEYTGIDVAIELKAKGALVDQNKGVVVDKRVVTGKNVRPVQVATEVLKLLNIQFPAGVADMDMAVKPLFYPNPATSVLHTNIVAGSTTYSIYTMTGQMVQQGSIENNSISVSALHSGQYIIHTNDGTTSNSSTIAIQGK